MKYLLFALFAVALLGATPRVDHVTLVVMENRDFDSVIGNPSAPYFNKTLVPQSAVLNNSHAIGHPSEPNYLELFSGSNQGVTDDSCPHTWDVPNLASQLLAAGQTFTGYAESLPSAGYAGCRGSSNLYARKHAPWTNFSNVPAADSQPYAGWPAKPASFVFLVPNMCNDMHDCSVAIGDAWMAANLPRIIAWNAAHNGLLIVTWDEAEPDDGSNRIPTLLAGPMVKPGTSNERTDDFGILRTIESVLSLPCIAHACDRPALSTIWRS
jgi:hypothetical protein